MDELAGLVVQLRAARIEADAAAERVQAHILADGEARLLEYLEKRTFDFATASTRAWYEAHTGKEVERLSAAHTDARCAAWALERAIVDLCLRLCPCK
jgi:uncharacterized protein YdaT